MKHSGYRVVTIIWLFCLSTVSYAYLTQNFTVTNQTGMTITAVYISLNDANLWKGNVLTTNKLKNNETFEFIRSVDQFSCVHDIKFISEDGKEFYMNDVNLCISTNITLIPTERTNEKKEK